jgi:hypothetical protein
MAVCSPVDTGTEGVFVIATDFLKNSGLGTTADQCIDIAE